jgi:L-iditol 2-dehydrogenase
VTRRRMRAAVLHGREDVRIEQVDVPAPGRGEILLRNAVALTCGTDAKVFRRGYHARMIQPPALFGHEVAGTVEEVGPGVHGLEPGTRVAVANSAPCGRCPACLRGRDSLCDDLVFWNGAYAEFARIPWQIVAKNVMPLPDTLEMRAAAMVEPLACAVRGIERSHIESGSWVVVIGVGPIGLMLLALARRAGARILAVGKNKGRLARALELGAEESLSVGDLRELPRLLAERCGPAGPRVVIEAAGQAETAEAAVRSVGKGGLVNLFAGCAAETTIRVDVARIHYEEITVTSSFHHTPASVRQAMRLITSGEINPDRFITGQAPLDELPRVLSQMASGASEGLKTAILTASA